MSVVNPNCYKLSNNYFNLKAGDWENVWKIMQEINNIGREWTLQYLCKTYDVSSTFLFYLQQAIEAGSFLESEPMTLKNGDVEAGFKGSDVIIEGKMSVGGQEHFYLETHGCIAVPMGEDSEMTIFTSTQHPGAMQVSLIVLH